MAGESVIDQGSSSSWDDWRWQIKNSVKTVNELKRFLPAHNDTEAWISENFSNNDLPFAVTPYFISLMKGGPQCPIFAQVISSIEEFVDDEVLMRDPLGEESLKKVPHLVHRYPDRVLFLATDRCASYCRFCTRKRWVGQGPSPIKDEQEEAFKYIESDPLIREIIFSGGDPLMLSNERIAALIRRSFSIKHIDWLRFHSRMLSFAPMRIDAGLCSIFADFNPIYLVTHFNHPREITDRAALAIRMLLKSGVMLLNQSVLLKNINDDEEVLKELFRALVKLCIRPFYMHQCDVIIGARHFRVPIMRSIELMNKLRGHISGLCQPTLVVDIPGGHGKVALAYDPVVDEDDRFVYLKGFRGGIARYPKD